MKRINIDRLSEEIKAQLKSYSLEVETAMIKATDRLSKQMQKEVIANSPVKTGSYKKGWKRKRVYNRYLIYNSTDGSLVHLLEYGHAKRNGGRVEGKENLIKQYKKANTDLPKAIKEEVEKIGRK